MFRSKTRKADDLKKAVCEALAQPEWLEFVTTDISGNVTLIIRADPENLATGESHRLTAESTARAVRGVNSVRAILTSERISATPAGINDGKKRYVLIDQKGR